MRIDRAGQEFAHFPVTGAPTNPGPLQVSFDGTTWSPMTWAADLSSASVLVAGPAMPSPDPTGVILTLGRNIPTLRLVDSPETVIRSTGGSIDVT